MSSRVIATDTSRVTYTIKLTIAHDDFSSRPLEILHNVTSAFRPNSAPALSVTFRNEAGIDAGGLSREFVSELCSAIKDKMKYLKRDNGLYEPYTEEIKGSEIIYQNIGKLMMFCLNRQRLGESCPMGMILDQSVFIALNALANTTISQDDFNKPERFNELFAIYKRMKSINENDQKMIQNFEQMLAADKTEIIAFLNSCGYDNINASDPQKQLQQYIVDSYIKPRLAPLLEIVEGMKSVQFSSISWETVKAMNPETLSEQLQGVVTREEIVQKMTFRAGDFPPPKDKWITNWIMTTTEDNVKKFLFAVTGAPALGTTGLKISKGVNFYCHTCFNLVDIPRG